MKFIVDRMLGKLAKELRMLGYDTLYDRRGDTAGLLEIARQQGRTVVTRKTVLPTSRPEDRIIRIRADVPHLQLKELIAEALLSRSEAKPFSRCVLCNLLLAEIPPGEAEGKVPDFVLYHHTEFFRCPECGRIYWKGTHQKNMEKWLEEVFGPPTQE